MLFDQLKYTLCCQKTDLFIFKIALVVLVNNMNCTVHFHISYMYIICICVIEVRNVVSTVQNFC